ncbi:MAG: formate transporter [Candidatus Atribacteria bacterium]|nr:formate transporter [Candidatus Atribacteria bacterium]
MNHQQLSSWCQKKISKNPIELLIGGFLAGAFIGFGGQLFTVVTSAPLPFGVSQLLGGLVFSVGLIMVILGETELFTGNCLLSYSCYPNYHQIKETLINWGLVYGGNFLGALFLVFLYHHSGLFLSNPSIIERAGAIVMGKLSFSFGEAFIRGILCNWLVCLAVLFATFSENNLTRIAIIPIPIVTFVALGYEHSIANMYFLPAGKIAQAYLDPTQAVSWGEIFGKNLIPVTLGNIVGGCLLVGFLYWFILSHRKKE